MSRRAENRPFHPGSYLCWVGSGHYTAPCLDVQPPRLPNARLGHDQLITLLQVDEGLSRLRARSGGLTAAEMAKVAQDDLADILRHVHWNKVIHVMWGCVYSTVLAKARRSGNIVPLMGATCPTATLITRSSKVSLHTRTHPVRHLVLLALLFCGENEHREVCVLVLFFIQFWKNEQRLFSHPYIDIVLSVLYFRDGG